MAVNAWMVPFLKMFGLEKVNGISHFAVRVGEGILKNTETV